MKEPEETYIRPAVVYERLADDGWPEDAGWWPIGGCTWPAVKCSRERVHGIRLLSPSQLIRSLLANRNRTSLPVIEVRKG